MCRTLTQVLGAGCPEDATQSWCQGENCHSPIWEAGSRTWPCTWAHLAWKVAQAMSQSVISQPRAPRPQSLRAVGKLEEGESAVGRRLYHSSMSCPNYSVIIEIPEAPVSSLRLDSGFGPLAGHSFSVLHTHRSHLPPQSPADPEPHTGTWEPWASHTIFLSLSFLIHKMGMMAPVGAPHVSTEASGPPGQSWVVR